MKYLLLVFLLIIPSLFLRARTIYVVTIGICDYKYIKDLHKSETDAKSVANLYKTHTTHVTTLLGSQATHSNILQTINREFSKAVEGDVVVLYFSGHGGKGGLCAYDTRDIATSLTYKEIQNVIRNCKADNKQIYIDACFSGGLRTKGKSTNASTFNKLKGVMLFLSSRSDETSRENMYSSNGFFTQHLVRAMKGGADKNEDLIITARELFDYVSKNTSKSTGGKQNPVMWGNFADDMHIMNWNPAK